MIGGKMGKLDGLVGRLLFLAFAALTIFILGAEEARAQAAEPGAGDAPAAPAPLCRMGVNVNSYYNEPGIEAFDTAPLRIGWYINYNARTEASRPQGMKFAPVIRCIQESEDEYRTQPAGAALEESIRYYAGQEVPWVICNEPDRPGIFQDEMTPALYARAYHELRAQIKAIDPTAKVLAGNIVQATPVRMQYLDLILAAHEDLYGAPMEVDAWAIHGFVLNEVSCINNPNSLPCWGAEIPPGVNEPTGLLIDAQDNDSFEIFRDNIVRMRRWMANNGYRNVPLYLSEYGVLMPNNFGPPDFNPPFTPDRVNTFMTRTFDYLLNDGVDPNIGYPPDNNRLVQYLSWYSTSGKYSNDRPGEFNGYLFDPDRGYQISPIGANYRDYAAGVADELDFSPLALSIESPFFVLGDRALVVVGVQVANAGHNLYPAAVPVRLYAGSPAANDVIGSGMARVRGCGERYMTRITIEVPWNDGPPNSIAVTAVVNPDGSVDETNTDDNTRSSTLNLSGIPAVFPIGSVFLPLLRN